MKKWEIGKSRAPTTGKWWWPRRSKYKHWEGGLAEWRIKPGRKVRNRGMVLFEAIKGAVTSETLTLRARGRAPRGSEPKELGKKRKSITKQGGVATLQTSGIVSNAEDEVGGETVPAKKCLRKRGVGSFQQKERDGNKGSTRTTLFMSRDVRKKKYARKERSDCMASRRKLALLQNSQPVWQTFN